MLGSLGIACQERGFERIRLSSSGGKGSLHTIPDPYTEERSFPADLALFADLRQAKKRE